MMRLISKPRGFTSATPKVVALQAGFASATPEVAAYTGHPKVVLEKRVVLPLPTRPLFQKKETFWAQSKEGNLAPTFKKRF